MVHTLLNWLRLDAQNLIVEVWWCVLILWCLLLLVSISDVAASHLGRAAKAAWIAVILLLPLVGLFTYCVFCLKRVDYFMFEFLVRRHHKSAKQPTKSTSPNL